MTTGRIYRISELMQRYRTREDAKAGKFRLFDTETGAELPAEYDSEDLARAGARLQAACDIDELYRPAKA